MCVWSSMGHEKWVEMQEQQQQRVWSNLGAGRECVCGSRSMSVCASYLCMCVCSVKLISRPQSSNDI